MSRRDDRDERLRLSLWDWFEALISLYTARRSGNRHLRRTRGAR